MFNPTFIQRLAHRVERDTYPLFGSIRRKCLNNLDFSIISNNCWGGIAYEYYGLPKQSPTVGTFFYADDYIRFVLNFESYINKKLELISIPESKFAVILQEMYRKKDVPIGVLDDVEFVFLHYADRPTAREKWERRVKRVNFNNLIFKFSYHNNCSSEHLLTFERSELMGKKFMFVPKPNMGYSCGIYYPGFENDKQIENDTFYWNRYFDVTTFINHGEIIEKS